MAWIMIRDMMNQQVKVARTPLVAEAPPVGEMDIGWGFGHIHVRMAAVMRAPMTWEIVCSSICFACFISFIIFRLRGFTRLVFTSFRLLISFHLA